MTIAFLVGPRGCGKSTLGKRLAERLWRPFVEMDERTLARFAPRMTVREVWSVHGEAAWRAAEAGVTRELLSGQLPQSRLGELAEFLGGSSSVAAAGGGGGGGSANEPIVAAGGGAPTVPDVAALLNDARREGKVRVIYLACSPAVLWQRLEAQRRADGMIYDAHRPPLTAAGAADSLGEIEAVVAQRDPLYRAVADAVLDVTYLDEEGAANYLVRNCL